MVCYKCVHKVPDDSEFCQYCGAKLEYTSEAQEDLDNDCVIKSDNKFSLSYLNELPKEYGNYNTYGNDIKLITPKKELKQNHNINSNRHFEQEAEFSDKNENEDEIIQQEYVTKLNDIDNNYGLVANKPVFIKSEEEKKLFLQSLYTILEEDLIWKCRGSIAVDGISIPVEIYDAYLLNNAEYKTLYIAIDDKAEKQIAIPNGFSNLKNKNEISQKDRFKKKKLFNVVLIISLICIFILIGTIVTLKYGIPEIKYQKANKYMKREYYGTAILMYEELGEYKDSKDKILEAKSKLGLNEE